MPKIKTVNFKIDGEQKETDKIVDKVIDFFGAKDFVKKIDSGGKNLLTGGKHA